ncbi:hypothetical protein IK146_00025 [Candidatus Saccharibacteria bacterium]|nr:hypothetical protein [Candidatus Saccharibacteria bacterium]
MELEGLLNNQRKKSQPLTPTSNSTPASSSGKKRAIFIVVVSAVFLLIIAGVTLFVASAQKDSSKGIEVSEGAPGIDDETGGEEYVFPENQRIDFLSKYGVSEDDMVFVEDKIIEVIEEYYGEVGYDQIFYNNGEGDVTVEDGQIKFTVYTDVGDRLTSVTIKMDGNRVKTVYIY